MKDFFNIMIAIFTLVIIIMMFGMCEISDEKYDELNLDAKICPSVKTFIEEQGYLQDNYISVIEYCRIQSYIKSKDLKND